MNRLEAMHVFIRVAELSSFTRAAESLGLPKASASTAVAQLEAALGTRLLQRTTRRVQMTQDGRAFYERARDLLSDMDELSTMFQQSPQALRGRIRVDMTVPFARDILIPRLPEFLRAHPQLELELSSTDRLVDVLREGFDCVLRVGPIGDTSLIARPIGQFEVVNCVSPAYLRKHGTPRAIEDLARHQLIHYAPTFGGKPFGFEYPTPDGFRTVAMSGALTVNNAEAYTAACLAGLGIIQAPSTGVRHLLKDKRLVEILKQHRAEPMPIWLLYPERRGIPKRVQAFMQWVSQVAQPHVQPNASPSATVR